MDVFPNLTNQTDWEVAYKSMTSHAIKVAYIAIVKRFSWVIVEKAFHRSLFLVSSLSVYSRSLSLSLSQASTPSLSALTSALLCIYIFFYQFIH